jgi:hypothetical protein
MKLNKTYLLFISLLFLTTMASRVQVEGVQASIQKEKSHQIHKTESADYGFMDFLFEEDTRENEDEYLFTPFTLNPVSSLLFPVNKSISSTFKRIPTKAFAFFKTPIFLTFRNLRL